MTGVLAMSPTVIEPPIAKPPYWLSLTEPLRAGFECLSLVARWPELASAPRGDGHPVLVIPGFATTDAMTKALRIFLAHLGYRSEPWGLGFNTGYRKLGDDQVALNACLAQAFAAAGEKISLIGWSLGGVMARQLARDNPDKVRSVITLGAPFTGDPNAIAIKKFYEIISGEHLDSAASRQRFERDRQSPKVRTTALYSKSDGITAWQNCLEQNGENLRNIEIKGSHLGLTHNPDVLLTIAAVLRDS